MQAAKEAAIASQQVKCAYRHGNAARRMLRSEMV